MAEYKVSFYPNYGQDPSKTKYMRRIVKKKFRKLKTAKEKREYLKKRGHTKIRIYEVK